MSHCGGCDITSTVIGEGLLLYDTESGEVRPISEQGRGARRDPVNCCLYDGDATTWLFVEAGHVLRYDLRDGKTRKVQVKIPEKQLVREQPGACCDQTQSRLAAVWPPMPG